MAAVTLATGATQLLSENNEGDAGIVAQFCAGP
jgi:hypothetical protein